MELHPNGYGFLRSPDNNYSRERTDPFVPGTMIDKYGLRPHCRFDTEVTGATWDESAHRWRVDVRTADGVAETLDARFVVVSTPPAALPTPTPGGHDGGPQLVTGAVSAAASGGFTLTEADGTVVTVTTTSSTTYGETGSQTAPSGVSDGDQVRVRPVDGTPPTATAVTAAVGPDAADPRVDRHAHIGEGQLGIEPFQHLVNDKQFRDLPMVLETPKEETPEGHTDARNLGILRGLFSKGSKTGRPPKK